MHATIFERREGHNEIFYIASIDDTDCNYNPMQSCVFFSAGKSTPFEIGDVIRTVEFNWYLISFIKVRIEGELILTSEIEAYNLLKKRLN